MLPIELIGRILAILYNGAATNKYSPSAILPLALVSPIFRVEAERLIYAHLHLKSTSQVVKCFKAIERRPFLANHTRGLSIQLSLNSSEPVALWEVLGMGAAAATVNQRRSRHIGRVMKPFADLLKRTLSKMTNLQDYSLSLGGQPGRAEQIFGAPWLPADAPFKLRRFIVDLNLSPMMIDFLVSQPAIVDLLAPWFQADRGVVPKHALPQLKTILCNSPMAAALVPRRPVRRVAVKDGGSMHQPLGPILESLPELAKASVTVRQFDAAVHDMTSVGEQLWGPLQSHLPRLESITLRRSLLTSEDVYNIYLSDAFTIPLSTFSKLKHLVLPAPHPLLHLRAAGIAPIGMIPTPAGAVLDIFAALGLAPQVPAGQPGQPPPMQPANFQFDFMPGPPDAGAAAAQLPPPNNPAQPAAQTEFPEEQWPTNEGEFQENMALPDLIQIDVVEHMGDLHPPAVVDGMAPAPPADWLELDGLQNQQQGLQAAPQGGGVNSPGPVHFGPPPPPPPVAAPPAPMIPPLPPFLQGLMNFPGAMAWIGPNGNAGAAGGAPGGAPVPPNAGNQAAQPLPPFPGPANAPWHAMGPGILIHGTITHHLGPPAPQPLPHPPNPPVGAAPPFGPGGGNMGGSAQAPQQQQQQQQQPPLQPPQHFPGGVGAGLQALGAQIQNTTNAIMNMIVQSQANANQLHQQLAQTQANLAQVQEDLTALENATLGAVGEGGGAGGPPPPPLPLHMPVNFNTTIVGFTAGGEVGDEDGAAIPRRGRSTPDPREDEVLEKARRDLKEKELLILEKWKMGGIIPNLKTVTFDMDNKRRTTWTWKAGSSAIAAANGDSDAEEADGLGDVTNGRWEVEYTKRG
ncbi:hypothetical protein FRB95_011030 [Tulasnella sp. JGI-2019a]|nr:hypothetical protein FRB95_011030 [Tulasnella sp. JGI-2019a]